MARVLVTGATGFVGRELCSVLAARGYVIRAAVRSPRALPKEVAEQVTVGEIGASTSWEEALQGVDCVMHLAARAHILGDRAENAELYMETNARGTLRLAQSASVLGVSRFVYLSSVKVNGEATHGAPYRADDQPAPQDAYGLSKWQGERDLHEVAQRTGLRVAIVRPPLVYGPGVRANFLRLLRWVDRRLPLPFGRVSNRRSLVSSWNLCDLLAGLLQNEVAYGRTWMVSDGQDLSTPELIRMVGEALRKPARLLPVPVALLRVAATAAGRGGELDRLCGSLTVDLTATRDLLGWVPPLGMRDALARTAAWYRTEVRTRAS